MKKDFDLLCMGRSCIDLYSDEFGAPLYRAMNFTKSVGGSPMNIAIGSSRLGLKVGAITGVGTEENGHFLRWQLACEGVNTEGVKIDPQRLTAMVLLSIRGMNDFPLIQYRENCADMGLTAEDVDESYLARSRALLVTGTHLSKPGVAQAFIKAVTKAKELGLKCILDIDYRPNLWGLQGHDAGSSRWAELSEPITQAFQKVLPLFDLIVGTAEEYHIAGGTTDDLEALRKVRQQSKATLVFKLGEEGCAVMPDAIPESFAPVTYPGFPVKVYNSIGAGDGFMSGFLRGWLRDEDIATCCRFANAAGAFAVSRLGCSSAYPSWEEMEYFLEHGSEQEWLRKDAYLEQLHWATNRKRAWKNITVLAFDHQVYFEKVAAMHDKSSAHIAHAKNLIFTAMKRTVEHMSQNTEAPARDFGILVDDVYGMDVLLENNTHDFWVARNIAVNSEGPLTFLGGPDVGMTLKEWPENHIVKCLMRCSAEDTLQNIQENEAQLRRLFHACRSTGHEFLLEFVVPLHEESDSSILHWMQRCYTMGIYPDYWKLLPKQKETWEKIESLLDEKDPYCRGVMLLGQDLQQEKLQEFFNDSASSSKRLGFAIGRSIFGQVLAKYFAATIDEEGFIQEVQNNYMQFLQAWDASSALQASHEG